MGLSIMLLLTFIVTGVVILYPEFSSKDELHQEEIYSETIDFPPVEGDALELFREEEAAEESLEDEFF